MRSLKKRSFILLIVSLVLLSACETQHSTISYNSNSNNVSGGSNGNQNTNNNNNCCNGCNQVVPTCTSVVTIVDEKTVPIRYAEVMVYGDSQVKTYFTDINGQILASGLKNGNYVIKVIKTGYDDGVKTLTVRNNTCPVIDVIMTPPQGPLSCIPVITVKDSASPYAVISGAKININGTDYYTNLSGIASIAPGLEDGDYPYSVTAGGYDEAKGIYMVSDNICPDLTVSQRATPCDVSFLIMYGTPGAPSMPVGNQLVSFTLDNGTPTPYTTGPANGAPNGVIILSPAVAPGLHTYSISYTSGQYDYFQSGSFSFTAGNCPDTITVNMHTTSPLVCTAMFTVTDADTSSLISGAQININGHIYPTVAGVAYIPNLADGTYYYTVTKTGYTGANGYYTVTNNSCPGQPITMDSLPCDIDFQIMYGGNPVIGQEITFVLDLNTVSPDPVTDTDGGFTILNIHPAIVTHNYQVSYTGSDGNQYSGSGSFSFQPGFCRIGVQVITMVLQTCDVPFTLINNNTGPIEGATISLTKFGGVFGSCQTDSNGECTITGLTDGTYAYTATVGGHVVASNTYIVSGLVCAPVEIDFCNGIFTVEFPENGGPVEGAMININGQTYFTDQSGHAYISDFAIPGLYGYTVDYTGYTQVSATYSVVNLCPSILVTLTPLPPTTCDETFSVTDGTSPIAGATIVVYQGRNIIGSCITGSNGQCTITGLVDGDYTYSVAATGYTPITDGIFNITGLNCSTINVVLSLQTCSASFHVHEYIEKTQTYQDIAGAHAYIGLGVGNIVSCTTDANGLCSIPGIPDGDYPYEVHYSGHTLESGTYHVAGNICPAITTEFMICNVVFYIYHNTQPPEPFVGAAFYLDSVYYANSDASGGVWFNGANALYTGTYQYDVYQSGPPPAGWHIPFAPPPLTITIPQSGSCPGLQSIAVPET